MAINWQQFGLKTNPYDTLPLVEGGELPLEEAFIGREKELRVLNDLFESETRACLTICGDTGVGKTSLINFQKFIWKYHENGKLYFSCRREMEASDLLLDKQNFILEIIGSILREINLIQPELLQEPLLTKLNQLVDYTQTVALQGGLSLDVSGIAGGFNFGREKKIEPPYRLTTAFVERYFFELLQFIKTHAIGGRAYHGLIVHINNFDVLLQESEKTKKIIIFFNEIRDLLQTPDTFFLFLGPPDLYGRVIAAEQRVKSIFVRTPLIVEPLTKTQVKQALEKRMELLRSDNAKEIIKPINDEVVSRLYDLYEGDIRSIMTGLKDVLSQCQDRLLQPLTVDEALLLLGQERWERVASQLGKEQRKALEFLVTSDEYLSATKVAKLLKKQLSNISTYYFKPLKNLGIIEEKQKQGRTVYFGLTTEFQPLRWWFESQKNIQKNLADNPPEQPTLF